MKKNGIWGMLFILAMVWVLLPGVVWAEEDILENRRVETTVNEAFGNLMSEVAIEVPEYHGIEPKIKLVYNSASGNGWLGVGWGLQGISIIQRTGIHGGAPGFDANDVFTLDGMEMVSSTKLGGTHCTKLQTYNRIVFDSTNNLWYVWTKNGTKYTYSVLHGVAKGTWRWALSTVQDTKGNQVNYYYVADNDLDCYLDRIEYNGVTIKFYKESRPDYITQATGCSVAQMCYRLKAIDVLVSGYRARAYQLTYESSVSTGRSVLSTIQQFGNDASVDGSGVVTGSAKFPAITLSTTQGINSFYTMTQSSFSMIQDETWRKGDFNGDGFGDVARFFLDAGCLSVDVYLGSASGNFTQQRWATQQGGYDPKQSQIHVGDFTGDGKTDFAKFWNDAGEMSCDMHVSTGTSFNMSCWATKQGGISDQMRWFVGDFNGDGKSDLAKYWSEENAWCCDVHLSTGSSLSMSRWATKQGGFWDSQVWYVGDFNGDGRTDFAKYWIENGQWTTDVHLSTGSSLSMSRWATQQGGCWDGQFWHVGDFNGDGKTDFAAYWNDNGLWTSDVHLSTGSSFGIERWATQQGGYTGDYNWVVGDFTGDGRADFAQFFHDSGKWSVDVHASRGNSFVSERWISQTGTYAESRIPMVYDYNGDGKKDLMLINLPPAINASGEAYSGGGYGMGAAGIRGNGNAIEFKTWDGSRLRWQAIYLQNATVSGGWDSGSLRIITHVVASGNTITFTMHDGIVVTLTLNGATASGEIHCSSSADFAYWHMGGHANGILAFQYCKNNVWTMAPYITLKPAGGNDVMHTALTTGPISDLVTSINNGLGGETVTTYVPSSTWGNQSLPEGLVIPTVNTMTKKDGRNNNQTHSYSYSGLNWNPAARQLYGFNYAKHIFDTAGNYTETWFRQTPVSIPGTVSSIYRKNADGQIYNYVDHFYTENSSTPYTSLLSEKHEYEQNLQSSNRLIKTMFEYDSYGNTTVKKEYGDNSLTGDERTTVWGYYLNTGSYIVGLPGFETIYQGIGTTGTKLKDTRYVYDTNSAYNYAPTKGLLTKEQCWNNQNGQYIATTLGYDIYGNLTSITNPMNQTTTYTYDGTYHTYRTREDNALGHSTLQSWDTVLGVVTSRTDANNNQSTYTYDALGRLTQKSIPGVGTETYQYLDWGNPSAQKIRKTLSDGTADGLWQDMYFDGWLRTWKMIKEGNLIKETLYKDATDQVWKESLWYTSGSTPKYIENTFDGAGRLVKITYPDNKSTSTEYYVGWLRQLNELSHKKEIWKDAYGNITKVREWNGLTSYDTLYTYNRLDRLVQVKDSENNLTTIQWDSLGRRTGLTDPNTGNHIYTYNNMGSMLSSRDAKNQTITYTYDVLERMTQKTYPDSSKIIWKYDETTCINGKGQITMMTYPGGSEKILSYDKAGNITKKTVTVDSYSYTFEFAYDALNRLTSVKYPDGETVTYGYSNEGYLSGVSGYVNGFTYNAAGKPLTITYANGTTEEFTYDANREWMNTAKVKKGTTTLYDATYSYDAVARVIGIDSTSNPLMDLSFTYDDLNRLTGVTGGQSQSFAYDSIGNMTYNSAMGNYSYGDVSHIHAVTSAGSNTYTYDANGNMLTGAGRNITWNAENRVNSITLNGQATTFVYNAKGQRIKKSSSNGTTYYFDNLMERTSSGLTNYIYAGKRLVAKKLPDSTKNWYHQDHLSSIRLMTNSSGTVVKKYDYAVYGKVVSTSGSAANNREFIGEIADEETGLCYLRARYYDPELARFISSDALVPDPTRSNPQALNRYSYAFNNPVDNTDPTGELPLTINNSPGTANLFVWPGYNSTADGKPLKGPITITPATLIHTNTGQSVPTYVIGLAGTQLVQHQATFIITDLLVGFEFQNNYLNAVRREIMANVPRGSNLVFAGHSLGGMVAQMAAADSVLKSNYNILYTVTFGSPLISPGMREGRVTRLADVNDPIPFASVAGALLLPIVDGNNYEDGGFGINQPIQAHNGSYRNPAVWGDYDAVGIRGGDITLQFEPSLMQFYHAPTPTGF